MLTEKKEKKKKLSYKDERKLRRKKNRGGEIRREMLSAIFMTTMRRFAEVRFNAVFFMENALIVYSEQQRLFNYTENTKKMAPSPI
jgi:hypothetical protein